MKCTIRPSQYGCSRVNIGWRNGSQGTRNSHSDAEVAIDQGRATAAIWPGLSRAVQRPNTPKNTSAQEKSAHW